MLGLRHRLRAASSQRWLRRFQSRNPNAKLGHNIRLKGIPIFSIGPTATLAICENVTFNSDITSNLAGIFKPCSICVEDGASLFIDEGSGFSGVSIYCAKEIRIGKYLTCGANVMIWDTDFHPLESHARRRNDRSTINTNRIVIGDDVFLGANVLVLKGVEIGDRVIVAAGSVITKSVPADEIWGGNPARFIRKNEQTKP